MSLNNIRNSQEVKFSKHLQIKRKFLLTSIAFEPGLYVGFLFQHCLRQGGIGFLIVQHQIAGSASVLFWGFFLIQNNSAFIRFVLSLILLQSFLHFININSPDSLFCLVVLIYHRLFCFPFLSHPRERCHPLPSKTRVSPRKLFSPEM